MTDRAVAAWNVSQWYLNLSEKVAKWVGSDYGPHHLAEILVPGGIDSLTCWHDPAGSCIPSHVSLQESLKDKELMINSTLLNFTVRASFRGLFAQCTSQHLCK